jgi:hypothetical protein
MVPILVGLIILSFEAFTDSISSFESLPKLLEALKMREHPVAGSLQMVVDPDDFGQNTAQ